MNDAEKLKTQLDAEKASDGELMWGSEDNNEPISKPITIKNIPLANQVYTDDQNNEPDVKNGKKRHDEEIADGLQEKDVLTNGQQNNENSIQFTGYNPDAFVIYQSRL